jgi:hypothetical protein
VLGGKGLVLQLIRNCPFALQANSQMERSFSFHQKWLNIQVKSSPLKSQLAQVTPPPPEDVQPQQLSEI